MRPEICLKCEEKEKWSELAKDKESEESFYVEEAEENGGEKWWCYKTHCKIGLHKMTMKILR
jgi:hypothetical protein